MFRCGVQKGYCLWSGAFEEQWTSIWIQRNTKLQSRNCFIRYRKRFGWLPTVTQYNIMFILDIMLCSVVDENHRFGGRCCIYLSSRRNVSEASSCRQNNGAYLPNYRCHIPEDNNVNTHCCENPKSHVFTYVHVYVILTHWTSHIPTPGTHSLQFHTFTSPFITSRCPCCCCCNEPRNTFIAHSNAAQRSLCDQELDWAGYECICQLECDIRINLSKSLDTTHYMKSVHKLFLSRQLCWMPTFCYLLHVLNNSAIYTTLALNS